MTDRIFLTGIAVHACHGVLAYESEVGQHFTIDLELELDLRSAAHSDRLGDTVSYAEIATVAVRAFTERRFQLIEAAANAVVEAILARFPRIEAVRIVVHKPHAPIAVTFEDAGIILTRRR